MADFLNIPETELAYSAYTYFEKVVGKLCTRQSRKVMWDMINTLFLTVAVKPTFVAFLYHSQTYVQASRAIVSNFFEKQWTQSHPQHLSGLSRALFPTTFLEAEYMK